MPVALRVGEGGPVGHEALDDHRLALGGEVSLEALPRQPQLLRAVGLFLTC